ncbi:NAD(P)-dependent oxidoreductase [Rurimicrobium arvi]|uniref:NAD(P)-dependent oxidoreductase n=1 Tax=Rurimicrobium arvi TaxID=2049916 RepID=A0ABP8MYA5_9BACT
MSIESLGFIGLGNMGRPMAANLEQAGVPLSVYNRSPDKAAGFSARTKVCTSVGELLANSSVIFTMLTDDTALEAVYAALMQHSVAGKLFVDMSTVSIEASRSVAGRLAQAGASFLDAPVAGSTKPATEGTLLIMAGGTDQDVQRAMPYLLKMGKQVKHLGPQGSGLAAKISVNYFLSVLYQGLAETVLLGDRLGVARSELLDIINESACGSGATKVKTPLLLADAYPPAFALDLMLKDINIAFAAGAGFPLGIAAQKSYTKAQEQGWGKEDVIGLIRSLAPSE